MLNIDSPAQVHLNPHGFINSAPRIGDAPTLIQCGLDVDKWHEAVFQSGNSLLLHDEWAMYDRVVTQIARDRLCGIADLEAANLVHPVGGLGTIVSLWPKVSDMTGATISLSAEAIEQAEKDRVEFEYDGVPIPIISKQFTIDQRSLLASRNGGSRIDTTALATATRRVIDKCEDMLFNGTTAIKAGGYTIPGYRTYTNRNTETGADWGTATNVDISIEKGVAKAEGDNFYGPFDVYLHATQYAQLRQYISTYNDEMLRDRVLKRGDIRSIRATQAMTAGEAVFVQLTSDVIDLAKAVDLRVLQWDSPSGMSTTFLVMAALAPRFKADYEGRCGIVHMTSI